MYNNICCICLSFSFSLFGVCLMAFHQAQYILNEFSTPSIRSNHNSVLSRDNGPVNNITPNGVKYVQRLFTICMKTNTASGFFFWC